MKQIYKPELDIPTFAEFDERLFEFSSHSIGEGYHLYLGNLHVVIGFNIDIDGEKLYSYGIEVGNKEVATSAEFKNEDKCWKNMRKAVEKYINTYYSYNPKDATSLEYLQNRIKEREEYIELRKKNLESWIENRKNNPVDQAMITEKDIEANNKYIAILEKSLQEYKLKLDLLKEGSDDK